MAKINAKGTYKSTPPTLANGDDHDLLLDASGNLKTVSGGTGATATEVHGNVAAAATDSGNPVKVGGKYNTTQPVLTDGQRGNLELGSRGAVKVQLHVADSATAITQRADNADAVAASATANNMAVQNRNSVFNGTTWDRMRGDTNGTLVESRYSYSKVTADTQVKGAAGFLHALTFSCNDAAPTAGSIIVYDSLTETGTEIFNHTFTTTPFVPFTLTLNVSFSTGLYIGFTTTNDVNVTVSYR